MTLRLNGSTSGYVEIDAPAAAGSNTLVLPTGNGNSGQVLSTNGSGTLSWVDRFTAAGPAFGAYASGATNTATSTLTKLVLVTEEFDTASCYDTTNSRFTPNVAGYYQINGQVGSAGYAQLVSVYKNGSEFKRGVFASATNNNVSVLIYLNGSTDYVELYWYQNSGSTVNSSTGQAITWFNGFLARPA